MGNLKTTKEYEAEIEKQLVSYRQGLNITTFLSLIKEYTAAVLAHNIEAATEQSNNQIKKLLADIEELQSEIESLIYQSAKQHDQLIERDEIIKQLRSTNQPPKDLSEIKAEWEKRCDYIKANKNVNTDEIFKFFSQYISQPKTDLPELTSTFIIGRVRERFKELEHKQWDWPSFYNGWLEGRHDILFKHKLPKP